jgi:hypothetical protein
VGAVECALRHAIVLRDQVDEDAEEGQEDHEDDPEGFGPTADVSTPKDVAEDAEQDRQSSVPR